MTTEAKPAPLGAALGPCVAVSVRRAVGGRVTGQVHAEGGDLPGSGRSAQPDPAPRPGGQDPRQVSLFVFLDVLSIAVYFVLKT